MSLRSAQQLQLLHIGPYGTPTARQRTIDRARHEHFCLIFQLRVGFRLRQKRFVSDSTATRALGWLGAVEKLPQKVCHEHEHKSV